MMWLRYKLAWTWRIGLIRRATAFRWEMDWALREAKNHNFGDLVCIYAQERDDYRDGASVEAFLGDEARDELAAIRAERDEATRNLGELFAMIFGDGGHRQQAIGDDRKAVEQAVERWVELVTEAEMVEGMKEGFSQRLADVEAERDTLAAKLKQAEELLRAVTLELGHYTTSRQQRAAAAFLASEAQS